MEKNRKTISICSLDAAPTHMLEEYWESLIRAELLEDRLCHAVNPGWKEIGEVIRLNQSYMFYVYHIELKKFIAEFTFDGFVGRSAQVHFSMHPDNEPQYSMWLARTCTDMVLDEWHIKDKPDEPFLFSLYGLTPVRNRRACAFVQRVGFKKVSTLKGGQWYKGEICDALITIKERSV